MKFGILTIKYLNILNNCNVLGNDLLNILQEVFTFIKICVPILCVIFITIDIASAVISDGAKNMNTALNRSVKRLIIGVVIFFIPTLVNLLLNMSGNITGTCGIR